MNTTWAGKRHGETGEEGVGGDRQRRRESRKGAEKRDAEVDTILRQDARSFVVPVMVVADHVALLHDDDEHSEKIIS